MNKDESFYFRCVVFQAEDTLFRVPVVYLPMDEGIFEDMFSLPNAGKEGGGDDNPIVLPGQVTAKDLRSFLRFILPPPITAEPRSMSLTEWSSVLRLCSMWCLDTVRLKAMSIADKQAQDLDDPVTLVLLGRLHSSWEWLMEGYRRLCIRERYLTREEQSTIGFETAARLSEVRESSWRWGDVKVVQSRIFGQPPPPPTVKRDRLGYDFTQNIHEVFEDELALDKTYPGVPHDLVS